MHMPHRAIPISCTCTWKWVHGSLRLHRRRRRRRSSSSSGRSECYARGDLVHRRPRLPRVPPAILDEARRRGCEGALGLIRACQGGSVKVGRRPRAQDIQKDVEGGAAALVDQEAALVKQLVQDDAVGVDVGGAAKGAEGHLGRHICQGRTGDSNAGAGVYYMMACEG